MADGPGKYDEECTAARAICGGEVVLIVFNGKKGDGFECQLNPKNEIHLASVLRSVADDIEAQVKKRYDRLAQRVIAEVNERKKR